jgi:RNA polymerase sigma-70 factor (ECF subfamily)
MDDPSIMTRDTLPVIGDRDDEDAALVALALVDQAAFVHLYTRYADRLYWYALGRTASDAIADDVVSETMIAAIEGLRRFDPTKGSFASWLFTIAARRVADRERSHRRFWRAAMRWWYPPEPLDDSAEIVQRNDEARRVRQALADLSHDDRELILLRYGAELTSQQIADILDLTPGAVRMRLSRLRERLARELGTDT